ncbi:hypothetical protein KC711_00265 [Candidatus Peregrinibacteria bacterium]|nr:hypothetical protein [Candidatus Peregrinibacteria bacterium]MCB9804709.1 hypothetical protein [Candidatus Peribacteria bacterium]
MTVKGKDYGKIVFPQQKLLTGDDCETDGGAGAPAARAGTGTEAPAVGKETPIMNFNKVFYKDGAYYLTGPNGKPTKVEYGSLMHNFNIPA